MAVTRQATQNNSDRSGTNDDERVGSHSAMFNWNAESRWKCAVVCRTEIGRVTSSSRYALPLCSKRRDHDAFHAYIDTGYALSSIGNLSDTDVAVRQMSSRHLPIISYCLITYTSLRRHAAVISLRKFVNEHWSPYFSSFKGNAPPVEVCVSSVSEITTSSLFCSGQVKDTIACAARSVRSKSENPVALCMFSSSL